MGDADDVIVERLMYLRNELAYLNQERDRVRSFRQYVGDVRLEKAVERSLQVAIEACLDIGRRLIALEGFRYPEDNKDVFRILCEEGVVPEGLLPSRIDMARFRNLIVHDYPRIDDARVYGMLKKRLDDFDAYTRTVVAYLEWEETAHGG
ncbi:MAG: DUF86 domain-containing protein [Anaerolineae bacterium]|nr:DUF86 domain-containing protein [Anaerolineae bacterium]MDW8068974.1 DUF86 domain-containing protein [Anaerolineae bacterium]